MLIKKFNNLARQFGLSVRLVEEKDAEKILQLRTDQKLSQHLMTTIPNIENQIQYIRNYKIREKKRIEYYFAFALIESNVPIGFYRVHSIDFEKKTFTIGSWIFESNIDETVPILSDILSKSFGFEILNLNICFFDVRRDNKKVMRYHQLYSPIFINEDKELNNYFYLRKDDFIENREKVLAILI